MRVCFATSECVPFVKTGGLADVSGALPRALTGYGCEVKVFVPSYSAIKTTEHKLAPVEGLQNLSVPIGDKSVSFDVWHTTPRDTGVEHYFIDCPEFFYRPQIYTSDADEDERFLLFQLAVIEVLQQLQWTPDIFHCNDWECALLPVFLKEKYGQDSQFANTASILSIHNLAFQGVFPKEAIGKAGLSYDKYYPLGPFEFYGHFSFLKAGILYADAITTVSETYAVEIQTRELGAGLEGVLASKREDLFGVLNGIDTNDWNPRRDKLIPHPYDIDNLSAKLKNKQALLEYANLPFDKRIPTIGMITRLTEQKGLELLPPVFSALVKLPVQFVVLGSGEQKYEKFFRRAARKHPERVFCHLGFNNELAHLITAGCDMFLMPSRFEPCGLNQMYSLNYGTVPIVRRTGGLADTVKDYHDFNAQGNGFSFEKFSPYALLSTIQRALSVFHQKRLWREIMKRGMREDFSWPASARKYKEIYQKARRKRGF